MCSSLCYRQSIIVNQYVDHPIHWYNLLLIKYTKIDGFTCKYNIECYSREIIIRRYCDSLISLEFYISKPYDDEKIIQFDCNGVLISDICIPKNTIYFKYELNFVLNLSWLYQYFLISDIFCDNNIKIIANGIFTSNIRNVDD